MDEKTGAYFWPLRLYRKCKMKFILFVSWLLTEKISRQKSAERCQSQDQRWRMSGAAGTEWSRQVHTGSHLERNDTTFCWKCEHSWKRYQDGDAFGQTSDGVSAILLILYLLFVNLYWSIFSFCPQHEIVWESLTVEEHMLFYLRLKGTPIDAEMYESVSDTSVLSHLSVLRGSAAESVSNNVFEFISTTYFSSNFFVDIFDRKEYWSLSDSPIRVTNWWRSCQVEWREDFPLRYPW